ncbi:MAG: hypothetical protein R3B57_06015 [Phycisphaerales bacterium]
MQIDDITPQIVPLPAPPAQGRYLFESPLVVLLALVIAALVALLIFNAQAKLKLGAIVAGAIALLAVGVWALATAVVTPRERLIARAKEVIDATAAADVTRLRPMLAEQSRVRVGGGTIASNRESILTRVADFQGEYHVTIESHRVAEAQAAIDGPQSARTQLRVKHSGPGLPSASWWLIEWRRESEDSPWVAEVIEPLWISGYGNLQR